jgi:LysM repeat protein
MLYVQIYYEVVYGDTVTDIARRFGIDVPKLTKLNTGWLTKNLDDIKVGDLISIQ